MKYEVYILSLLTEERKLYIEKTLNLFPFIKIFNSVNGYDKEETIKEFLRLNLDFHKLKRSRNNDFNTYGTLACWITKVKFLQFQVANQIPYTLFIEDDTKLLPGFFQELDKKMSDKWKTLDTDINIIRLFQWGEAYMTSISSAKRLLDALKNTGVVDNIDNQLRENSGPELKLNFNDFYRKWVKTNEGDVLKTEPLDEYFFDSLRK